jgi:hypothetical protein
MRLINSKFLGIIIIICSLNCSSPTSSPPPNNLNLINPPIISGIYETTYDYPDGTGKVIGFPSYVLQNNNEIKGTNVFPNPYCDSTGNERYRSFIRYVTFTHLPVTATITIIRGVSDAESFSGSSSFFMGISTIRNGVNIVRTIQKNDSSQFCRWDLKDYSGKYVTTGYYRAYISWPLISSQYWLDISLNFMENKLTVY